MIEEIIIVNNEPFYRIPNGTSYDYAPIPKEFKPYFERLQQENKQLKEKLKIKQEVIEEVRIYIEDNSNQMSEDATYDLLQILDKGERNE